MTSQKLIDAQLETVALSIYPPMFLNRGKYVVVIKPLGSNLDKVIVAFALY